MQTPGQRDRSNKIHGHLMNATREEIDALEAAKEQHRLTIDGNDTGMSEDEAQAALDAAQAAYDKAYRRAYDEMPAM